MSKKEFAGQKKNKDKGLSILDKEVY